MRAMAPAAAGRHDSPVGAVPNDSPPTRPATAGIRTARSADLEDIIDLDARVTGLAKPEYWRAQLGRCAPAAGSGPFFLVATRPDGRNLAGFALGEVRAWEFGSEPCGWLVAIAVDPEARLAGRGAALLEAMMQRFRECGVARVRTMVARDNRLLLLFFRAAGLSTGPYLELDRDISSAPEAGA
jgi:GNAT superfamily N-acetyltransferase